MGNRPLKFALDVAMSGAMGLDLDVQKLSPEDRRLVANAVSLYKERVSGVTSRGDLYRLESPYAAGRSVLNFVSEDQTKAMLFIYQVKDGDGARIKLRGLDPQRRYAVREINLPGDASSKLELGQKAFEGTALMTEGLKSPVNAQFTSAVIELLAENF
jgi:alpha-galactosidase